MDFTLDIYSTLNQKYQSKFNFYFSKPINEIVFYQTSVLSTVAFKDAAIASESFQYLKRIYFLVNQNGVQQIFQRIIMLANFYDSAILLRYQYPSMIITNTQSIFLRRLKRKKKILTEQGSSDESNSNQQSKEVQLHTDAFLDSVNSSQLSKKTQQLKDDLYFQFNQRDKQQSFDSFVHDIHNPQAKKDVSLSQSQRNTSKQSFAQKLLRISKNISLSSMVNSQAIQFSLAVNQGQINHLIFDFQQIDEELTLTNYEKLKQKQMFNSYNYSNTNMNKKFQKKKIHLINQMDQFRKDNNQQNLMYLKQKRPLNRPKQVQFSSIIEHTGPANRRHSQYEQNIGKQSVMINQVKKSFIQQTNFNADYFISQQNKFNPSNSERARLQNRKDFKKQFLQHLYGNVENRPKINSKFEGDQQKTLRRYVSSNNLITKEKGPRKGYQQIRQSDIYANKNDIHPKANQNPRYSNVNQDMNNLRFPSHNQEIYENQYGNQQRYLYQQQNKKEFSRKGYQYIAKEQDIYPAALVLNDRYSNIPRYDIERQNKIQNYQNIRSNNVQHRISPNYNTNRISSNYNANVVSPNYNGHMAEKQQKKKIIRQKAAQLLNRVKSQDYLVSRIDPAYLHHPKAY